MTYTFQGWQLVPEGARLATSNRASISARDTAVGKKARADMRERMASSTMAAVISQSLQWLGKTQIGTFCQRPARAKPFTGCAAAKRSTACPAGDEALKKARKPGAREEI
jgi:hypothetical protein